MAIGRLLIFPMLGALLLGCAGDLSGCRTPIGDRGLTPRVAAEKEGMVGEWVTWGGRLIEARHRPQATELELIAYPLNECGRPLVDQASLGRFILLYPGYLETAELRSGRQITATGRLVGVSDGEVGAMPYRLALLEDPAPRFWPETRPIPDAGARRPVFSIGIGAGTGWSGGGVGVRF